MATQARVPEGRFSRDGTQFWITEIAGLSLGLLPNIVAHYVLRVGYMIFIYFMT